MSMLVNAAERSVHRRIRARDRKFLEMVFTRLSERLKAHEERIALSEERLATLFTTALITREIARLTTDRDKLLALRNETINSAMPSAPDEDLRQIYISMTATLTGLHLRIFGFLTKPELFGAPVGSWRALEDFVGDGPIETHTWDIIRRYVPGAPDSETIQHCLIDLVNQGVVAYQGEGVLPGFMFPLPTNFGWGFYSFIIDEDAADELPIAR